MSWAFPARTLPDGWYGWSYSFQCEGKEPEAQRGEDAHPWPHSWQTAGRPRPQLCLVPKPAFVLLTSGSWLNLGDCITRYLCRLWELVASPCPPPRHEFTQNGNHVPLQMWDSAAAVGVCSLARCWHVPRRPKMSPPATCHRASNSALPRRGMPLGLG